MIRRLFQFGLFTFWLLTSASWAQVTLDIEGQVKQAVSEQKARIQAELQTLADHPWAGTYHGPGAGFGGSTLTVAPEAGFAVEMWGCYGVFERNYGRITVTESGNLHLDFDGEERRMLRDILTEEIVLVPWGPRLYLVPADDLIGFCNACNEGWSKEGICLMKYFFRGPDLPTMTDEAPRIPPEYLPYLLSQPITASIVNLGRVKTIDLPAGMKERQIIVTIDQGQQSGLLPGMTLHVVNPENGSGKVVVELVEEERSIGTYTLTLISDLSERLPEAGWQLSTQLSYFQKPWEKKQTK